MKSHRLRERKRRPVDHVSRVAVNARRRTVTVVLVRLVVSGVVGRLGHCFRRSGLVGVLEKAACDADASALQLRFRVCHPLDPDQMGVIDGSQFVIFIFDKSPKNSAPNTIH